MDSEWFIAISAETDKMLENENYIRLLKYAFQVVVVFDILENP